MWSPAGFSSDVATARSLASSPPSRLDATLRPPYLSVAGVAWRRREAATSPATSFAAAISLTGQGRTINRRLKPANKSGVSPSNISSMAVVLYKFISKLIHLYFEINSIFFLSILWHFMCLLLLFFFTLKFWCSVRVSFNLINLFYELQCVKFTVWNFNAWVYTPFKKKNAWVYTYLLRPKFSGLVN